MSEALKGGTYLCSDNYTLGRANIPLGPEHRIGAASAYSSLGRTAGVWEASQRAR